MEIRQYQFRLTGMSPLILHADDIEWADFITEWRNDPANSRFQKTKGDDRQPGFTWIGALTHDGTHIALPAENLHRALRDGGSRIPTGRKTETFKRQSQSGMLPVEGFFPILTATNQRIPFAPFAAMAKSQERDFRVHRTAAQEHGFQLFVKRAAIGASKHVRVRPMFSQWSLSGTMSVWDETITPHVLQQMFTLTGAQVGVGDWRPSSPKAPGHYGRFEAEVAAI